MEKRNYSAGEDIVEAETRIGAALKLKISHFFLEGISPLEDEQNLANKKLEVGEWNGNARMNEAKFDPECSSSKVVSSLSHVGIIGPATVHASWARNSNMG